ncbi:MAG TPA: hypothetical protein VIM12_01530 [Noviherbaspirillum sp.]|jgi:hypothetical protein|uniref:hypothetical protein n=1 Tax=Noviherbaspirillum sp. TaxID=1926288 RepID=UPI002F945A0C
MTALRLHAPPALLALSLLAAAFPARADTSDFSGAWQAWLCPEGVQRESGKCSTFVLELHQKGERLCGVHTFSTADATRVDEGVAPSLSGTMSDEVATVTVTSTFGRAPVPVKAELRRTGATLQWLRLDAPKGDFLLPQKARLTRAKKKSLFAPLFAQELQAVCLSAFNAAELTNAPATAGQSPGSAGNAPSAGPLPKE